MKRLLAPLALWLVYVPMAHAQDFGQGNLKNVGDTAKLSTASLPVLIGNIIRISIGLLGLAFLLLTVYAGFLWLTAGGEPKKVDTAKNLLRNGVIGLFIVSAAFAIASFVIAAVLEATKG